MWAEVAPVTGLSAELTTLIRRLQSLVPENRPTAIDAAEMLRLILDRPRRRRRRLATRRRRASASWSSAPTVPS